MIEEIEAGAEKGKEEVGAERGGVGAETYRRRRAEARGTRQRRPRISGGSRQEEAGPADH